MQCSLTMTEVKHFIRFAHTVAAWCFILVSHADLLKAVMFWVCSGATRTLKGFLHGHLLLHCHFGIIVMLEDPATFHLQCSDWSKLFGQNPTVHGPLHPSFSTQQLSSPLCRKAAPKHNVSTSRLYSSVLGMQLGLLPPPNTASGSYTKEFHFGLI